MLAPLKFSGHIYHCGLPRILTEIRQASNCLHATVRDTKEKKRQSEQSPNIEGLRRLQKGAKREKELKYGSYIRQVNDVSSVSLDLEGFAHKMFLLFCVGLALFAFQMVNAQPSGPAGTPGLPDQLDTLNQHEASNDLDCVNLKPGHPKVRKQHCRGALNKLIREFRGQSDYILTQDEEKEEDPDFIVVPHFNDDQECVIILDLPYFQQGMMPVGHLPTIIRHATTLIESCVEKAERKANGGRVFVPAEDNEGEFEGELIGIYISPNLVLHEIQQWPQGNRSLSSY